MLARQPLAPPLATGRLTLLAPRTILALSLAALLPVVVEFGLVSLDRPARAALILFGLAIIGWGLTRLDDTLVALLAALGMALWVFPMPDPVFAALGNDLVWLLIAAFILADALKRAGLADRIARLVAARARTPRALFHGLGLVMLATAFVVPSTSGRAALMIPVHAALAGATANPRPRRALALLFPTAILLSAFASLTGAGAHLLAAEMIGRWTGRPIGFLDWALLGLPFALARTALAVETILLLFLTPEDRRAPLAAPAAIPPAAARHALPAGGIAALVVLGWFTAPLHGVDDTLIALAGALLLILPGLGGGGLRDGLKAVEWPLILFMASTIAIADGLTASGVSGRLVGGALDGLGGAAPVLACAGLAAIGLLLHLVVQSRTARVSVLLPPVLAGAAGLGLEPAGAGLLVVAATGFCQTLMASAKPVAMFGLAGEGQGYGPADLLRLSLALLPMLFALLLLFALAVWPALGFGRFPL